MSDENCCGACGYPIHATKDKACDWCRQTADRIEELEAKLAKAVEALRDMCAEFRGHDLPYGSKAYLKATTTLAEIEGEKE
jgi:hypothetical protein